MTKKILVTGGSGFIGSALVRRLTEPASKVDVFDAANGHDLCNRRQVRQAIQGKDAVFHLAAVADLNWARVHPIETMRVNVEGTWNVVRECAREGAALYFASTCCVFGNQKHHPVDEDTLPNPAEIYACSKLAGENLIRGFHLTYGLQYNHMRFATIYGEGVRPALATHIFMGQALRGEPITVHGDGKQTRTLTHVDDLVEAITVLYESRKMNGVWNITNTEEISALKMAEDIRRTTGSKSEIVFIPQRIGQTLRESVSADKMWDEVGWRTKVGWDEGIKRMYKWFLATNQVNNIYRTPQTSGEKQIVK